LSVRDRLKTLVALRGISSSEIARRLSVDKDWVSRRLGEREDTKPGNIFADEIERFAGVLQVSPCALVDDAELERALRGTAYVPPTPSREDREPTPIHQARTQRVAGSLVNVVSELSDEDAEKVQAFAEFLKWQQEQGR
jgi:transcriptional regulator with XRE-family HTH domain